MDSIEYLKCPIEDNPSEDISQYFASSYEFITKALNENEHNKVLVHCWAGVSRSASVVTAYLIKSQNMTFFDAIEKIREKRKVWPNDGFKRQLYKYQIEITGKYDLPDDCDPSDYE